MIKLIGFDLDDTLLGSDKSIPDIDSVKLALQKGVKVALCSGRPYSDKTKEYYQELGINEGYYCGYNGVAIYDIKTKECIYENSLNKDELFFIIKVVSNAFKEVSKSCDLQNLAMCIHYDGNVYSSCHNPYVDKECFLNKNEVIVKEFWKEKDLKAYKFMIDGEPEVIQKVYPLIEEKIAPYYNIMISMPCFIEIIRKDSNKYFGLKQVAKLYGFNEDEIMAFGDSMNDYELVRDSYVGVAMGNALDKVKEVATFVTDTNDSHGIKNALKKYNII